MQSLSLSPAVKHLVLLGGGHSHLAVLKRLGMHPVPGLSVTLVSKDIDTPYSGCLPGYIEGVYSFEDMHIDLRPLAKFAGARIIHEEVCDIDLVAKRLCFATGSGRPPLVFDALSINIGSRPDVQLIKGADVHALTIKPLAQFIPTWMKSLQEISQRLEQQQATTISIIGGGPASIELAFSSLQRLRQQSPKFLADLKTSELLTLRIICREAEILQRHNEKTRRFIATELNNNGIEVVCNESVSEVLETEVLCASGLQLSSDFTAIATGAALPPWTADIGLQQANDGFIAVNNYLQSESHPFIFAAGDAATITGHPRPKSGVYAVRHGKPLAENLLRFLTGKRLRAYRPQVSALALISLGNGKALASRKKLFFEGKNVWRLKRKIDLDFIRKYSDLPEMQPRLNIAKGLLDKATLQNMQRHAMRCAGCGGKVGSSVLENVLGELQTKPTLEDAAITALDNGQVLLQTIDQIQAPFDDPWLFGQIATQHALSDIYAMGAQPSSALALVGLPFADAKISRATMKELMLGCQKALQEAGCELLGGHSAEAEQLSLGLSVSSIANPDSLMRKQGMNVGEVLILTKALGTGTLLAADMRHRAKQKWIEAAVASMLQSNRIAAEILLLHEASACTDITGFGLAGHLLEMLSSNTANANAPLLCAQLELATIPLLEGCEETLKDGIVSSLHHDNKLNEAAMVASDEWQRSPRWQALFDPQTSGGLLAAVPLAKAERCIQQLRAQGMSHATGIGLLREGSDLDQRIRIL